MHFSNLAAAAFAGLSLVHAAPAAAPQSTLPLCDPSNLVQNGNFQTGAVAPWSVNNAPQGMFEFSVRTYTINPNLHYFSGIYIPSNFLPGQEWWEISQNVTNNLPATIKMSVVAGMGQSGTFPTWTDFKGSSANFQVFIDGSQLRSTTPPGMTPHAPGNNGFENSQAWFNMLPITLQPGTHTLRIRVNYNTAIGDTEVGLNNIIMNVSPQTGCRTS